jgi:predicted ATPase
MSTPDGPSAVVRRQPEVWIRRVRIRNFRSIAYCDVELKPLTVLVGRNGSGKSNFIDAILFVRDALENSFSEAVGKRGGFRGLCYLGASAGDTFTVELELRFVDGRSATYSLEIGDPEVLGYYCASERLTTTGFPVGGVGFTVEAGQFRGAHPNFDSLNRENGSREAVENRRKAVNEFVDRHLNRSRLREFVITAPSMGEVQDTLTSGYHYVPWPSAMRAEKHRADDNMLAADGGNTAVILARLQSENPEAVCDRINAYLKYIVPVIDGVRAEATPAVTLLALDQVIAGRKQTLYAHQMSDGTLRALACLVAVAQRAKWGPPVRLVAIEEPETSIHPAAVRALVGAFDVASVDKQVLITTHSPDLIDRLDLEEHQLLAVESGEEGTRISPVDEASREAIREGLYRPGELLQMGQLQTDWRDVERQRAEAGSTSLEVSG